MPEIKNYPRATRFTTHDVLLKDGSEGTKQIYIEDAVADITRLGSDSSLSQEDKIAPAKTVGQRLAALQVIATQAQE